MTIRSRDIDVAPSGGNVERHASAERSGYREECDEYEDFHRAIAFGSEPVSSPARWLPRSGGDPQGSGASESRRRFKVGTERMLEKFRDRRPTRSRHSEKSRSWSFL